ncbi:MAG TPA: hypothetical protein VGP08_01970 [Pyrinomonadaceae bacterium]|nr:hypothetical protein [Pyrinomonadaceae bacterium]
MTTERRNMKSNVVGLACALVILALCATGSSAFAREDKVEESVLTGAGSLDIVRVGDEDDLNWELRLGKKTLQSMEGASFVHFVAHFMQLNMGEVVVVSVNSGGTACPAQFQVVRIVENGAQVSEEFGDCSDSPTITLKQLPEEEITFGFPGYYQLWQSREPGFVKPAPTTYVYKNGVLKELKTANTKRRGK